MLARLKCALRGHQYRVLRLLSPTARKIGCACCGKEWAMSDSVRCVVRWDADFEALYAPGGVLDPNRVMGGQL